MPLRFTKPLIRICIDRNGAICFQDNEVSFAKNIDHLLNFWWRMDMLKDKERLWRIGHMVLTLQWVWRHPMIYQNGGSPIVSFYPTRQCWSRWDQITPARSIVSVLGLGNALLFPCWISQEWIWDHVFSAKCCISDNSVRLLLQCY